MEQAPWFAASPWPDRLRWFRAVRRAGWPLTASIASAFRYARLREYERAHPRIRAASTKETCDV